MWHEISVREELKEKILEKIPKSLKREYNVEKYAHDYVYSLKLGMVKVGDERLVKEGTKYVCNKIGKKSLNSNFSIF